MMIYLSIADNTLLNLLMGPDILKVMIFLVGFLVTLMLKESIDRYKKCLAALIDFHDEFISLWYHAEMTAMRRPPPMRIIISIHMICFALSLARYLLKTGGFELASASKMVQPEFRNCAIFDDTSAYASILSNPQYSELILVSWLKTCGIFNGELRKRVEGMRSKVRILVATQRVKSPRTSTVLLRFVIHSFLILLPLCADHFLTRCLVPVIVCILISLVSLAEELEDPFGDDQHDIPWTALLANICHCTLPRRSHSYLAETVEFLNDLCLHCRWDESKARRLLGDDINFGPFHGQKFNSGIVHLSIYLTLPGLHSLDVIGRRGEMVPEVLMDISEREESRRRESCRREKSMP